MKKTFFITILSLFVAAMAFAQNKTLPSVSINTMEGQSINVADLGSTGKITVIIFWATWESHGKKELDNLKDYYSDWQGNYGLNIIAVNEDNNRAAEQVPVRVQQKGWEYRILHDYNNVFQNAANISTVPYTLLIDANGSIVYEHANYEDGFEFVLEEQIKLLAKN